LQADRVEHPRGRLDDARSGMTFAFREEQPLRDDRAERRQIDDVRVLDAVAEAAARRDERVLEAQRADLDRDINQRLPLLHRGFLTKTRRSRRSGEAISLVRFAALV